MLCHIKSEIPIFQKTVRIVIVVVYHEIFRIYIVTALVTLLH